MPIPDLYVQDPTQECEAGRTDRNRASTTFEPRPDLARPLGCGHARVGDAETVTAAAVGKPLLLLVVGSIVLLAISGCGSDSNSGPATTATSEPITVDVVVKDAKPEGGIKRATVKQGDDVVLVVHSDVADEIHLHGYDLMQDVEAGGTAKITFVASIPGQFEAELEQRGVQIAQITVEP